MSHPGFYGRRHRWLLLCWLTLALLLIASLASSDELYKWRDAEGHLHFTDSKANIPAKYRPQAQEHRPKTTFSSVSPHKTPTPTAPTGPAKSTEQTSFSIPYVDREGSASRIIIDITFNGRVTAPIMVDTGSPGLVITDDLASRLGLYQRDGSQMMVTISGIGGSAVALRTIVDRLQIGGVTETFIPAHVVDKMADAYDGPIGMDVLSGYTLTIDPTNKRLVANLNPAAKDLPGGRDQHWWQAIFSEFRYYNEFWKKQADWIDDSSSPYGRLANSKRDKIKEFIAFQKNESDSLMYKLEQQARWKLVPRHWRR